MSERKIYIEPCMDVPITSLTVLIDSLYKDKITLGRRCTARPTFSDKECTIEECHPANRSFEDLLCLSQTYFPETTEVELMRVLKELCVQFYYCRDIHKMVFHFNGGYQISEEHLKQNKMYDVSLLSDTYSVNKLLEIYTQI